MYKIALSTCGKKVDESLFAAYRAAGIDGMELTEDVNGIDREAMVRWSRAYGVTLCSYHVPFAPFDRLDPSFIDEDKRRRSVAEQAALIRLAAQMGFSRFVLHASGEPIAEEERSARMAQAKKSLRELAEVAAACGGVLCVENLPRTCLGRDSDDMQELLSADPRLRSCLDTNHLLKEDLPAYIRRMGASIVTTHVSDYDRINERHWLPGEGVTDWAAVLLALHEVGYDGPWLYEVGFTAPDTIRRERDLTCADIARNAGELLAGETLTVIGSPKPNLGMWG